MNEKKIRKSKLREFNKRLKLNDLQPVDSREFEEMRLFKLGYELEIKRLKKLRVRNYILISVGVIMMVGGVALDGYGWVIEVIKLILE